MLESYIIKGLINSFLYFVSFFIVMKKLEFKYHFKSLYIIISNFILIFSTIVFTTPISYTTLDVFVLSKKVFYLGFFIIIFINSFKMKVKDVMIYVCVFGGLYFLRYNSSFYIYNLSYLVILDLVLICMNTYKLNLKQSYIYSVIFSAIYLISNYITDYFGMFISVVLDDRIVFLSRLDSHELEIVLRTLCVFIILYNFKFLKNIYLSKKYYIYISITVVVNALIIMFLNLATDEIYNLYDVVSRNKINYSINMEVFTFYNFVDFAFPTIIISVNVILISVLISSIKSAKEEAKRAVMNEKLDMQYSYYTTMKDSQEKVRELYHDMNKHIENIKSLKNNIEEVDRYIDNINSEVDQVKNLYSTGNLLLDTILNEKSRICKNNKIEFICDINFFKCQFIEMIDVTSIFSNLLDNAIEACSKMDDLSYDKYISLRGTFMKGYYVIRCENSKVNEVNIKHNRILTSKKDKYLHGIGIQSIKSSLRKYNGELEINVDENKFIVSIYIPIK